MKQTKLFCLLKKYLQISVELLVCNSSYIFICFSINSSIYSEQFLSTGLAIVLPLRCKVFSAIQPYIDVWCYIMHSSGILMKGIGEINGINSNKLRYNVS